MPLKSMVKEGPYTVILEIESTGDEFDAAVRKAVGKESARMAIPGFRKGKAPRSVIERMYGADFFYEAAADALLPGLYEDALY